MEEGHELQQLNPGYRGRRDPIVAPDPVERIGDGDDEGGGGGGDGEVGPNKGTQPHISHLILPLALNKHRKQRSWALWGKLVSFGWLQLRIDEN